MNILLINHNGDLYGASRSMWRLARRLVAEGHTVSAVMPEDGPLADALRADGVACRLMPELAIIDRASMRSWGGRFGFLRKCLVSPFTLAAHIRRIGADVVHTNCSVIVTSGLAARLSGRPHMLHVREHYDEFKAFWPWYRRLHLAMSDRILCVSGSVARQFPASPKVVVRHNGFPLSEFAPPEPARVDAFRDRIAARPGQVLIGLPGRIKIKRKGQETFIEAAARLCPTHPDARFLIIGEVFKGNESHREILEARVRELGLADRILFTGECQDMPAAYAALDIVVMASGQPEPFGGVVIEAMAMGKPVVGTHIGGTPEQIEDGATGILVPPDDPAAMAAALDRLLGDPALRAAMGRAGRERFEKRFEFEPFFREMLAIYKDVAKRR